MPQFHPDCSNVKDLQYLNNCMKMSWSTPTFTKHVLPYQQKQVQLIYITKQMSLT